jgi:hypothetical protein
MQLIGWQSSSFPYYRREDGENLVGKVKYLEEVVNEFIV